MDAVWNHATPAEARGQYVRSNMDRIERMIRLLDRLAVSDGDTRGVKDLVFHFQQLRTTAPGYGFDSVASMAGRGERDCIALRDGRARVDTNGIVALRTLVEAMRRELEKNPATPEEPAANPWWCVGRKGAEAPEFDLLVVDETPELADMLERRFRKERFVVRRAATAKDAKSAADRVTPDVLVVDVGLKDGEGHDVVREVRSARAGDQVLVIATSGHNTFVDRIHAVRSGADVYFEKPLDMEMLCGRIQEVANAGRAAARILCVSDDPNHSPRVRNALEPAGFEVTICENAEHYEAMLASIRPDALLLDVRRSEMSNLELTRYLRLDSRYQALPILLLTDDGDLKARVEMARAGADECLVKPVAPQLLVEMLRSRVARARTVLSQLRRDGLTRALTMSEFVDRVDREITRLVREPNRTAALVMIDVDHLKQVNEAYGHPTGDQVLRSLSTLVRRLLRKSDLMGRYGGEEFAVFLDRIDETNAQRVSEKLLAEFSRLKHLTADGREFQVTFSAGVAMFQNRMDVTAWLTTADRALYTAKSSGRARVMMA
ncbi:MAG TPA: diguanylate cyclase [Vicinamibacterales bacterium]|nr:diguanylate cyclase [Vicinamibacterales bacterium]